MKRLTLGVIAGATAGLWTLGCATRQCPPGVDFPNNPTTHTVTVDLSEVAGTCAASVLKEVNNATTGWEVRTSDKGDTINWQIKNNCSRPLVIGISDLRPLNPGETIDYPLVEAANSLSVSVNSGGGQGVFTAHTRTGINHHGRTCATTYVYDIQEIATNKTRQRIADPQIEIPR